MTEKISLRERMIITAYQIGLDKLEKMSCSEIAGYLIKNPVPQNLMNYLEKARDRKFSTQIMEEVSKINHLETIA
jgi:hypothetical protein